MSGYSFGDDTEPKSISGRISENWAPCRFTLEEYSALRTAVTTQLTTVERRLIGLLQENARMTNKDLARAAGIAESTCHEKVRSLQSRGVIHGFHADIDLRALGRSIRALITVRLQPKTTSSVNAFHKEILKARETLAIDTVTGADDFIIEVAVPDVESLRTFVLEHITSRTDVADARTSLVYEHHRRFVLEILEASPHQ